MPNYPHPHQDCIGIEEKVSRQPAQVRVAFISPHNAPTLASIQVKAWKIHAAT
jgi:hypothetical protein